MAAKKILETVGVLVMEYLPGHAMDYHTELMLAAPCLADIHSVPIPESEEILIHPQNPLKSDSGGVRGDAQGLSGITIRRWREKNIYS